MTTTTQLQELVGQAREQFEASPTAAELENAKARFLGKSGAITALMKGLASLTPELKRQQGAEINVAKQAIEQALQARRDALAEAELQARLAEQAIDVTLDGRGQRRGGLHPVVRSWMRIESIFRSIGFEVAEGPEIEDDWTNFTALNSPQDHPARSMQDTFYVDLDDPRGQPLLLRTHTSPMQVRHARAHVQAHAGQASMPDVRVIAPGRTYRVDSDATHSPMFHQFEGLWIGEQVSMADLKGVYTAFLHAFFERDDIELRFRPSYFPFTEPSAEIDMMFDSGPLRGRWLEISGAGQVHPTVLRNFGLDPERHIGFAFGSGIERLTMLRYGIGDLRQFYAGDLRFLEQFNAA